MTLLSTQHADSQMWYSASPIERILAYKAGIPAATVEKTAKMLGLSSSQLSKLLGLYPSSIARKINGQKMLSPEQTERVAGVLYLIGQIEVMVKKNTDEVFDAKKWFSRWIWEPVPALEGKPAAEYLDTHEGQRLISRVLSAAVSGVYL